MKARSEVCWMLLLAALLTVGYAVVCLLGWRETTTVLSGTYVGHASSDALRCFVFIALHIGFVVACPILLIAAMILAGLRRLVAGWTQARLARSMRQR